MAFSFGKKKHKEVVLIFDIGSASVGASFVMLSPKGPEVLYTKRSAMPIGEHLSSERILASTSIILKELVTVIEKEWIEKSKALKIKSKHIKHVLCVFASPWFVSHTKTFHIKKEEPLLVTKKTIEDIVAKERQEFEKTISDSKYASAFDKNIELLEHKIIQIKIEGYVTSNPYGKKAKDIELSFFESFISKQILQKFTEIIGQPFGKETIQFHTFSLASYSALNDLFPNEGTFLCMDITGEVTDISLVKNDVLLESMSFPSGRNFLIRTIMKKTNTNPEVALSYTKMHTEKHIEPKIAVVVNEAVKNAKEEWLVYLNDALGDTSKNAVLPRKIFVTVDSDVEPIFIDFLKSSTPPLSPIVINAKQLNSSVAIKKGVCPDPFISLEALFFNKIFFLNGK
ncbi:MAG: hypothetical protein KAR00_02145 [Candidatus Pacebacteria bacterium]|nr:hypothetical protein [Candidatus Paceibacterota bacterium]